MRPERVWFLALATLAVSSAHADESIGPYNISAAPISAVLVTGGGPNFNWLNVVNASVTIDQAFTGFSVIDDGYTNAAAGTTLRLTFAPDALQNRPGPDLVLFDADNDLNVYLVSTSHDGFGSQRVVVPSFDTGVDRSYFVGGTGPMLLDVRAATIDLSSWNIPPFQSVDQIRLFAEGPNQDPLGLGILSPAVQVSAVTRWTLAVAGLLLIVAAMSILRRRLRSPLA